MDTDGSNKQLKLIAQKMEKFERKQDSKKKSLQQRSEDRKALDKEKKFLLHNNLEARNQTHESK